jgi:hypothetical protein
MDIDGLFAKRNLSHMGVNEASPLILIADKFLFEKT